MRVADPRSPTWLCLTLIAGAACGSSGAPSQMLDAAAPPEDSGSQADAAQGDAACEGETLQALCSAAGYMCGDASFTDRCGVQVAGSCGTCSSGTCGEHECSVPGWVALQWPSLPQTRIFAMWSSPGSSTVWAGGGALGAGELWQIEGGAISILDAPTTLAGVHAAGADVWAVGSAGSVVHGNNGDFTLMPSSALQIYNLNAVWGFGPSDVWVTTANGVNSVAHWNGTSWAPGMLPSTAVIPACTGLWASGPDDLWAVCRGGEIFHRNATEWSKVASSTTQDLQAIYGFAANDVWAVGNSNTLVHWNGSAWRPVSAPAGGGLIGIWGAAANDVYAVGNGFNGGRVIHFDGAAWTEVLIMGSSTELDRVADAQGHVYAAGIPALLVTYP